MFIFLTKPWAPQSTSGNDLNFSVQFSFLFKFIVEKLNLVVQNKRSEIIEVVFSADKIALRFRSDERLKFVFYSQALSS